MAGLFTSVHAGLLFRTDSEPGQLHGRKDTH